MNSRGAERDPSAVAPVRIVFLGTPDFAVPVLSALLTMPTALVALVVTQPDRPAGRGRKLTASPVKAFATTHTLPLFQPERLRGEAVLARLREANADLFVIAAYGQLLREAVLAIPAHGTLNVHPSLLPRHRGAAPIPAAILAGDVETGVTIMLTDRGMDTGPILAQATMPLHGRETTAMLTPLLAAQGAQLLVETIPAWLSGSIAPREQDAALATTSRQFSKADGVVVWQASALSIERQVRALNPWPRAFTFRAGRRLQLLNAQAVTGVTDRADTPGMVLGDGKGRFLVGTGEGIIRLDEVQEEGARPVTGQDYLRNHPELPGSVLGLASSTV